MIVLVQRGPTVAKTEAPRIPNITWQEKSPGFSWAFASNRDGSEILEFRAFVQKLQHGPVEEAGFKYSLSANGKFLQRVKVGEK